MYTYVVCIGQASCPPSEDDGQDSPANNDGPPSIIYIMSVVSGETLLLIHKGDGTKWEGRYKSSLIQAETYLLTCTRYIELNPVRAGMVQDPGQYRWSRYRHNGLGQSDPRITPHPLYLVIDRNDADRQTAYRALFRSELNEKALSDIRLALTQGQPLGHGRFGNKICVAAGVRRTQKRPGRPAGKSDQSGDMNTQTGFGF